MVEQVILTADGQVERIEWKPPFSYIQGLKDAQEGGRGTAGQPENERTSGESAGSLPGTSGGPGRIRTCNQPVMSRTLCP
jgi:hypothetical protein